MYPIIFYCYNPYIDLRNSPNIYRYTSQPRHGPIFPTVTSVTLPTIALAIYVTPGADITNNRIERDIRAAEQAWGMRIFDDIINPRYIYENEFTFKDEDFPTTGKTEKINKLFANYKGNSPIVIPVYYVGANRLGSNSIGRAYYSYHYVGNQKNLSAAIIMANSANADHTRYSFAHELGHCLFAREEAGTLKSIDPLSASGDSHNNISGNIMNSIVSNKTTAPVQSVQREKAFQSQFVQFILQVDTPPTYPQGYSSIPSKVEIIGSDDNK